MKTSLILATCLLIFSPIASALPGYYEIKGTTSNIVVKNFDGLVDFALIIPGMNHQEIVNFDLGKVISPANDQIKVASYTVDLPSNLSLPAQSEKYFITINLNKPEFRAYVEDQGAYNMYALYGRFPLNEMVKGYQNGKSIFELVEFFDFRSGGTKTVPVKGDVSGLNLVVDEFNFSESYKVKAPTYAKDKVVISFSLFKDNSLYFPTDMKKVMSGKTMDLVKRASIDHWNLSLLMNSSNRAFRDTFDGNLLSGVFGAYVTDRATSPLAQVSYTFSPAQATMAPQFLPIINSPYFDQSAMIVSATAPQTIAGVTAYATTATLSEVTAGGTESFPIDFKKALWSTQKMGWAKDFKIPADVTKLIQSGKVYSWDVAYLGTAASSTDTKIVWTKVSHVTRNAIKF